MFSTSKENGYSRLMVITLTKLYELHASRICRYIQMFLFDPLSMELGKRINWILFSLIRQSTSRDGVKNNTIAPSITYNNWELQLFSGSCVDLDYFVIDPTVSDIFHSGFTTSGSIIKVNKGLQTLDDGSSALHCIFLHFKACT